MKTRPFRYPCFVLLTMFACLALIGIAGCSGSSASSSSSDEGYPDVPQVVGVDESGAYPDEVTITVIPQTGVTFRSTIDGSVYELGTVYDVTGTHQLVVTAKKTESGHERSISINFDIGVGTGFIRQLDERIIDGDGNLFSFKGVNIEGWLMWNGWIFGEDLLWFLNAKQETVLMERFSEAAGETNAATFRDGIRDWFITEADVQQMGLLGFNSIRLPLNHTVIDEGSWDYIDNVLAWAELYGLYVIIDFHALPGGQSQTPVCDPDDVLLWESEANMSAAVDLWATVATRYHDNTTVAAYDLINEPELDDSETDLLTTLYARMITAIRAVDANHMLILQGTDFARNFTMFDPENPLDENMAFTFHMYQLDDSASNQDIVETYNQLVTEYQIPIICGEFGEGNDDDTRFTREMMEDPANKISGWMFWNWKKEPVWSNPDYLNRIVAPAGWPALMGWVTQPGSAPQPTQGDAIQALEDFVEAVKLKNIVFDDAMLSALFD